jgi:hypothetical protein
MPCTITPSSDASHIVAKVVGDMTREQVNEVATGVDRLGSETGIRCYLIDVTESQNTQTVSSNFIQLRSDFRRLGINRRSCFAVLTAPDDHSHDLIETLAPGAGLDLTVFWDRAEAIAHLEAAAKRLHPKSEA